MDCCFCEKNMTEKDVLTSRLSLLQSAIVSLDAKLPLATQKKMARLEISVQQSSEQIGFLHAACIKIKDRYYLLAGPSGIGKTTYSKFLVEYYGGEIIADDWVGLEVSDDKEFYLSDINFKSNIKHQERLLLSGVFFLTEEDQLERDAFSPNESEFLRLIANTFDIATPEQVDKLADFWMKNRESLPFCHAIPTRQKLQIDTEQTLINLIERQTELDNSIIGIIGLGLLGQALAFQLGQVEQAKKIMLYDVDQTKSTALAEDLNQAYAEKNKPTYHSTLSPEEIFLSAGIIFMCFRDVSQAADQNKNVPERWARVDSQLEIVKKYAETIAKKTFHGTVFILSNPVEFLSHRLYSLTQNLEFKLKTYQVYGLGLELDLARLLHFSKKLNFPLKPESLSIHGNHSSEWEITTPLTDEQNSKIIKLTKSASSKIRQGAQRTVYGPTMAAIRSLLAFLKNSSTTLEAIQGDRIIGHRVKFDQGLPMFPADKK